MDLYRGVTETVDGFGDGRFRNQPTKIVGVSDSIKFRSKIGLI